MGWVEVVGGVVAVVVSAIAAIYTIIKVEPVLRKRTKLKADLEILEMLKKAETPGSGMVTEKINDMVINIYGPHREIRWWTLTFGVIFLLGFSFWTWYLVKDGFSWWAIATGFLALSGSGWILTSFEGKPPQDSRTLEKPIHFEYDIGNGSGNSVDVPVGFKTDFASVPLMYRWLVPKWGKQGDAAVIHDYLYWTQQCTRKESDKIFKEAMEVFGVHPLRKTLIYLAVSWFGYFAWKGNIKLRERKFNRVAARLPDKATDTPDSLQLS